MAVRFDPTQKLTIVVDSQQGIYDVTQDDSKSHFSAPLVIASSAALLPPPQPQALLLPAQAQPQRESSCQRAFSWIQSISLAGTVSYLAAGELGTAGVAALTLAYFARRPLKRIATEAGNVFIHAATAGIEFGHRLCSALGIIPEYAGRTIAGIGTRMAQASANYPAAAGALMTAAGAWYWLRS